MSVPAPTGASRAGRREWLGLAVLSLPTLLLSLDITVLHLAVPELTTALTPSAAEMLWIVDIYGFMIAGFLVTMGTLGDRIGRRRLLVVGAAAFAAASVAAAFAPGPEMLVAARLVMGVAGATLMPSTLSLISTMFRVPAQRGVAIGIWATMFSVGIALGPVVGGLLLEAFWWGSVFLLGVPVMVLLLITAPLLLPEFRDTGVGRPDPASVALSLTAMLPLTYAIKDVAAHGPSAEAGAALFVGVASGVLFVRRQRRLTAPLLDLGLFTDRRLRAALVVLFVSSSLVGGIYLFVTQYLQLIAGESALGTGLWLLPAASALVAGSLLAPALARRAGSGTVVAASLALSGLGYALLAGVPTVDGTWLLVVGFTLVYLGVGPVTALGTDLVVGSAPPERAGAASALSETSTELGVALGIAVLGSAGTAAYRAAVDRDLPVGAAAGVRETLAEAVATAATLPAEAGAVARAVATEAFTAGLHLAAWVAVGLAAATTVLAARSLRHAPAIATVGAEPEPATGAEPAQRTRDVPC